ncbi:MAG: hypothetical protein ACUVRD_08915 [Bacteroidia bacterium]
MARWRKWLLSILDTESKQETPHQLSNEILQNANQSVSYRLLDIHRWISKHISPYAWDRVCLKLYSEFIREKISPLRLDAATLASPSLVLRINDELFDLYGTHIPVDVIQNSEIVKNAEK